VGIQGRLFGVYKQVSLSGTLSDGTTTVNVNGTAPVNGSVTATLGMLNGMVTPFGKSRVTPLVGAGVGVAHFEDKIDSIGGSAVNSNRTETDLALSATAGIKVSATDSVVLGARYRYLWADTGHNGVDNFTAHNFMGTAAIKF
jgi:opacity protein-like surface antigen